MNKKKTKEQTPKTNGDKKQSKKGKVVQTQPIKEVEQFKEPESIVESSFREEINQSMQQPEEESSQSVFKIIVAIKTAKDHSSVKTPNIKCIISIQDKQKNVTLPFTEGQFFDLKSLSTSDKLHIKFQLSTTPFTQIGELTVTVSQDNIRLSESELVQDFLFCYDYLEQEHKFQGSFYAIILNKSVFLQENPVQEKKSRKEVSFNKVEEETQDYKGRDKKRKATGGEPLKRQQTGGAALKRGLTNTELDQEQLHQKIEQSVKTAMKEMQASHILEEQDSTYVPNRTSLQRAQTLQQVEEDNGGRISQSVQIVRSSTKNKTELDSPSKLDRTQTFNIDDENQSPNRLSTKSKTKEFKSSSPSRHNENYDHHCHENLTCLYYIDQANQSDEMKIQNDYLKKVIYALDKKVKALQIAQEHNDKFAQDLATNEEERNRLRDEIEKSQKELQGLRDLIDNSLSDAIKDKQQMERDNLLRDKDLDKISQDKRALLNELNQQKLKNQDLEKRLQDQSQLQAYANSLEKKLKEAAVREDEAQRNFLARANELGDFVEQANKSRQAQEQKLHLAQQRQLETANLLENQQLRNAELEDELRNLNHLIANMKNKEGNSKILKDQIQALQNDIAERLKDKYNIDLINDQLRKQIHNLHNQLVEKEKIFNDKCKELRRQLADEVNTSQNLNEQLTEKTKSHLQLKQDLRQCQLAAALSQDYYKQLEEEKVRSAHYCKSQQQFMHQSQEQSATIQQMNKQTNQLEHQNVELREQLQQSEQYAQNLKHLICEMKEKNISYIPIHNDSIDRALSDFINDSYDPLKLNGLFIRESEGVYQFGTKKLYIKIEQDKILIRTGGGFIGIQEFLDLYTPAELDKFYRLSPQATKEKNDTVNNTIDKKAKIVKEITHNHKTQLKVRTMGPVISKPIE